jgi:hypothetical protein
MELLFQLLDNWDTRAMVMDNSITEEDIAEKLNIPGLSEDGAMAIGLSENEAMAIGLSEEEAMAIGLGMANDIIVD